MDIEELKKYIDFIADTDIEVLEITLPQGEKICLKRADISSFLHIKEQEKTKQDKQETSTVQHEQANIQQEQKSANEFIITSPMVGKFLLSTSKEHPPFVAEGIEVKQGQKVGIIETMRIFRDVISPKSGVVKKILVEDGVYVEYGQPLIILELKE